MNVRMTHETVSRSTKLSVLNRPDDSVSDDMHGRVTGRHEWHLGHIRVTDFCMFPSSGSKSNAEAV